MSSGKKKPTKKTDASKRSAKSKAVVKKPAQKTTQRRDTAPKKETKREGVSLKKGISWEEFTASFRLRWLYNECKEFLQVFREPEAWVFVILGFVFATKALEVVLQFRGKLSLFHFLEGPFKTLGGKVGSVSWVLFVQNASRYARRIPAIFYQMVLPFLAMWLVFFFKERAARRARPDRPSTPSRKIFQRLWAGFLETARRYGFRVNTLKEWWVWLLFIFLIMIPIIIAVATSSGFRGKYPYLPQLRTSKAFDLFLVFEAIRGVYMLSWEFLFRGFILNAFRERFGYYAIFIQMIPYVMLHSTKPSLELYYTIPSALLLGLLAYRTRSIWPGFLLHFIGAVLFDFIALYA